MCWWQVSHSRLVCVLHCTVLFLPARHHTVLYVLYCTILLRNTGGLVEPPVVPRLTAALEAAGAAAPRIPAYLTTLC